MRIVDHSVYDCNEECGQGECHAISRNEFFVCLTNHEGHDIRCV